MSMSTLMVHLDIGSSNDALLKFTAGLAGRLDASVIGIATGQVVPANSDVGYYAVDLMEQERTAIDAKIDDSKASFLAAFQGSSGERDWRSSICLSPSDYVAAEARAADVIVVAPQSDGSVLDSAPGLDLGDLVLRAGLPILVVPRGVDEPTLERVVVAWSDTRESRRAVRDALPLLKKAGRVTLVAVAAEQDLSSVHDHLDDVIGWLARNHIVAELLVIPSAGDDTKRLETAADDLGADLLVAGAYGHSRLREWVLGGVTRQLLSHPARCSFLSH